jgi:tRNA pseudouridine55 synthase
MSAAIAMMNRPRAGQRAIDGVVLLDKPMGITSHTAVRAVRRLFAAGKAGHTGTLDPLATGLLPVCLGEATKFSHYLLEADKTYLASIRLGLTTTTGDLEGAAIEQKAVNVSNPQAESALKRFTGAIQQVPPMYSAIKHEGQRLYTLARAGQVVPRAPRAVFIRRLALVALAGEELTVSVTCSKGTYVRVLAEDIGRELGCGGCLSALRREAVGAFSLEQGALALGQLELLKPGERDAVLLPADALVASLPSLDLDAGEAQRLMQGRPVERPGACPEGLTRAYGPGKEFLGVVEVQSRGVIVPRRLRAQAGADSANRASIA